MIMSSAAGNSNEDSSAENGWGMLVDCESYGRHGDTKHDYKVISYQTSTTDYKNYQHASHGMLFAHDDRVLWKLYAHRAAILMQMRFDGFLGFPGGLVDPGEDPVFGLNREMQEEIGLDLDKYSFSENNHAVTFLHEEKHLVLHFFIKEITLSEFKSIEESCVHAPEYGIEALGCVRPPLFTMGDNVRGFPLFLCNQFAGNAREELLFGLLHTKLMSQDEISVAVNAAEKVRAKQN